MAKLLRQLYTLLFTLLIPLLLLRLVARARRNRGYLDRWEQRFGVYRGDASARDGIWLHAVSVGESMAAVPLIRALHEQCRGLPLLVTTTTPTGAATVERMLGDIVRHVYFPYDLPWILRRFFTTFRPRMLVTLETELWPNTLACCRAAGIPVVVANARLSARSLERYLQVRALSRELVESIGFIAAQTTTDAERFMALGADGDRVAVVGSLKFDVYLPASLREEAEVLRRDLGVSRPILMAGSTRAGEEPIILDALAAIHVRLPRTLLVIAPRHPERFDEVATLCGQAGFGVVRRSRCEPCTEAVGVYVVDTMGEVPKFYAAADVAFVGGSLLPYGGHNVLEPASLGVPVLAGPHTYNFAEICALLEAGGVLRVAADAATLAALASDWLEDSNERDRLGHLGRQIVLRHRGATERTTAIIARALAHGPAVSERAC